MNEEDILSNNTTQISHSIHVSKSYTKKVSVVVAAVITRSRTRTKIQNHEFQTACTASSFSILSFSLASVCLFLRNNSFSLIALSYDFCSSVFLGDFIPKPAAISLLATAVDVSSLVASAARPYSL